MQLLAGRVTLHGLETLVSKLVEFGLRPKRAAEVTKCATSWKPEGRKYEGSNALGANLHVERPNIDSITSAVPAQATVAVAPESHRGTTVRASVASSIK